jgi:hypothetical protein
MATKYWITNSGTWDNTDDTHWSTTTGGSNNTTHPTSGDDVVIDANSGTGTITVNADLNVKSITCGAMGMTLDFSVNNNSPTMQTWNNSGTGVRTWHRGTGTWNITGNAGTIWQMATTTNLTSDGTATINFSYAGSTGTRVITAGGADLLGDVNITGGDIITLNNLHSTNLNFTGFTGTFTGVTNTNVVAGSLTLGAGMTVTSGTVVMLFSATSSKTITTNGVQINIPIAFDGVGGTWTLQDDLDMTGASAIALNVINGSLITNGKSIKVAQFISVTGGTVDFGSATHEIIGASGTPLDTNGTILPGTYTLKFTDTGNGNIIFNTRGKTFNNVWFARGTSTGNISFSTNSPTFNDFKDDGTAAHSIIFTNGTTQTVSSFHVSGSAGNLITLSNSSGTTVANLKYVGTSVVSSDYLNIQYINVTPENTWYAGQNSNNTGGTDTNWIFNVPPFTGKQVAGIDENGRQTIICAYDGDGQTIVPLQANPTNHALEIEDGTTGTDNGNNGGNAMLDQNSRQVWTALSSADDGSIVEVYANSLNQLLINSN